MCALPGDLLRVLAELLPLSGLLVLVRCNRWYDRTLKAYLNYRLDNLFASTTRPRDPVKSYHVPSMLDNLHNVVCRYDIAKVLPHGRVDMRGQDHCFLEAPKGYDGRSSMLRLHSCSPDLDPPIRTCSSENYSFHRYFVTDSFYPDPPPDPVRCRFDSWLQRRCNQVRAKHAKNRADRAAAAAKDLEAFNVTSR